MVENKHYGVERNIAHTYGCLKEYLVTQVLNARLGNSGSRNYQLGVSYLATWPSRTTHKPDVL